MASRDLNFRKDFAARLRYAMDEAGINAAQLCRDLGINEGQFSKVLKAEKGFGRDTITRLAERLRVGPEWLYFGTTSKEEPLPISAANESTHPKTLAFLSGLDDNDLNQLVRSLVARKKTGVDNGDALAAVFEEMTRRDANELNKG